MSVTDSTSTTELKQRNAYRLALLIAIALLAGIWPSSTLAHSGPPPVPETLWSTWNVDVLIIFGLTLANWAYIRGTRAIWSRAGRGQGIRYWQFAAGLTGFFAIAVALLSPLDPLSSALFSAHMVQHMLLVAVAPPLLILGDAGVASLWALPRVWRRKIARLWRGTGPMNGIWDAIARPIPVLVIHVLVLWAWHVPALYDAAIRSQLIHVVEHVTLAGTGLLFWWLVIQRGRQAAVGHGLGLLMIFGLVIQKTALGALITFSPNAWYSEHLATTTAWGLTPAEDQQLAGAIMMGPWGLIYLIAAVTVFAGWLRAIERSVDRNERIDDGYLSNRRKHGERAKEWV
jgi:putative membrane protein